MSWTGTDESQGGFFCPTVPGTSPLQLPAPVGAPYGNRVVEIVGGSTAVLMLPDARLLELGGPHFVILAYKEAAAGSAAATASIYPNGASATPSNLLATVQPTSSASTICGAVGRCYLRDNSTQAGVWSIVISDAESTEAPTVVNPNLTRRIATNADQFSFELGVGGQTNVNIRDLCNDAGYDGTNAAHVDVVVGPQQAATNAIIGSTDRANPALETGTFPADSLIHLTILDNTFITGKGGKGGGGQNVVSGTVGTASSITFSQGASAEAGGLGLKIDAPTVLHNFGRIQGGGGGGQGGAALSTGEEAGAGGGGGAGYLSSLGGDGGSNAIRPIGAGAAGNAGVLNLPGSGAISTIEDGGIGGLPGAAGGTVTNAGGGAAGAAGFSISVKSGVSFVKQVAGNIDGAETTHS
tara:strand:+ start:6183 stop:7415 length:1233 start_codon:yes stop_codon:yes gene_type:complete